MTSSRWILVASLLAAGSGCAGRSSPTGEPLPGPVEAPLEPVIQGHSSSPTPWPGDAIEGAFGWFAIGSGTPDDAPPWGPIQASQPTIILAEEWVVPGSTTVHALVPGGRLPLVTQDKETGSYGCEGGHEVPGITPLQGEAGAGMFWVVSPTFGDAKGLELEISDGAESRTWRFGDRVVGLTRTDTHQANLWHGSPGQVVQSYDVSERVMEGAELEPADLEGAFLVPQVGAAWQVGSAVVVGLYWFSHEGVHFQALLIGGGEASLHDLGYLYNCGF